MFAISRVSLYTQVSTDLCVSLSWVADLCHFGPSFVSRPWPQTHGLSLQKGVLSTNHNEPTTIREPQKLHPKGVDCSMWMKMVRKGNDYVNRKDWGITGITSYQRCCRYKRLLKGAGQLRRQSLVSYQVHWIEEWCEDKDFFMYARQGRPSYRS